MNWRQVWMQMEFQLAGLLSFCHEFENKTVCVDLRHWKSWIWIFTNHFEYEWTSILFCCANENPAGSIVTSARLLPVFAIEPSCSTRRKYSDEHVHRQCSSFLSGGEHLLPVSCLAVGIFIFKVWRPCRYSDYRPNSVYFFYRFDRNHYLDTTLFRN